MTHMYCDMAGADEEGRNPSEAVCARRLKDLKIITQAIPQHLLNAAKRTTELATGDLVSVTHSITCIITYARVQINEESIMTLQELWLDASGRPHLTGKLTSIWNKIIEPAARWGKSKKTGGAKDAAQIAGPMRSTYPPCAGWTIPTKTGPKKCSLRDLTIKYLTNNLTEWKMTPPNSEKKWNHILKLTTDWIKLVWAHKGTVFTNMTHEKTWWKLTHRCLFVKHHDRESDGKCRMCGTASETMEHIIVCKRAAPLFTDIFSLLRQLGDKEIGVLPIISTFITNLTTKDKPASDSTRAILRITLRQHYAAIVRVDTDHTPYNWREVYYSTLQSIRTVATALGERSAKQVIQTIDTSSPRWVAKKTCQKAAPLLDLDTEGTYLLNPIITEELEYTLARLLDEKATLRKNQERKKKTDPGREGGGGGGVT